MPKKGEVRARKMVSQRGLYRHHGKAWFVLMPMSPFFRSPVGDSYTTPKPYDTTTRANQEEEEETKDKGRTTKAKREEEENKGVAWPSTMKTKRTRSERPQIQGETDRWSHRTQYGKPLHI